MVFAPTVGEDATDSPRLRMASREGARGLVGEPPPPKTQANRASLGTYLPAMDTR